MSFVVRSRQSASRNSPAYWDLNLCLQGAGGYSSVAPCGPLWLDSRNPETGDSSSAAKRYLARTGLITPGPIQVVRLSCTRYRRLLHHLWLLQLISFSFCADLQRHCLRRREATAPALAPSSCSARAPRGERQAESLPDQAKPNRLVPTPAVASRNLGM
jgi:hypothetical protein